MWSRLRASSCASTSKAMSSGSNAVRAIRRRVGMADAAEIRGYGVSASQACSERDSEAPRKLAGTCPRWLQRDSLRVPFTAKEGTPPPAWIVVLQFSSPPFQDCADLAQPSRHGEIQTFLREDVARAGVLSQEILFPHRRRPACACELCWGNDGCRQWFASLDENFAMMSTPSDGQGQRRIGRWHQHGSGVCGFARPPGPQGLFREVRSNRKISSPAQHDPRVPARSDREISVTRRSCSRLRSAGYSKASTCAERPPHDRMTFR